MTTTTPRILPSQLEELENLIDRTSLAAVLDAISTICHEKADHVRSEWQDAMTARVWDKAGRAVAKLAFSDTINSL